MKPFIVYLLRCSDGPYYVGQTDNIEVRMQQHHAGEHGCTGTRKPVDLVWQGEFETRAAAIAFEQQIKGWSRAKKQALIAGDWGRIQELAKAKQSFSSATVTLSSVRPELVEGQGVQGLRQAQPERTEAQPERTEAQPDRRGA